jgi:type I restriction enzyme, R subunit
MTLNESIVEDATPKWFGELGIAVGHGPQLAPGEPAAERDSFGDVVQFRFAQTLTPTLSHGESEKREAIRRLNPAIPEEASAFASHADTRATIKHYLRVRFERMLNP